MRFSNKVSVVTGGASGIGAATCMRLGAEDARVIVADKDAERAERVVARIREGGGTALFLAVDLAEEDSIRRFGAEVARNTGALHVLINNAGIARRSPIAETGDQDWHPQVAINLRAPALVTRELLPLLKAEGAAIVNVSSEGAFRAHPNRWVYDVTKAGMCVLARTMAVELAAFAIRANAVVPGWIVTEMHFGRADDPQAEKARLEKMDIDSAILHRLGRPEEIASAIAFLASDEASYITGTVLHVDGGMVAL